jgi:hypothetical protein
MGAGEITEGGCFVCGSALALAHDQVDRGHAVEGLRTHVYDLFISDTYMIEHYCKPLSIESTGQWYWFHES